MCGLKKNHSLFCGVVFVHSDSATKTILKLYCYTTILINISQSHQTVIQVDKRFIDSFSSSRQINWHVAHHRSRLRRCSFGGFACCVGDLLEKNEKYNIIILINLTYTRYTPTVTIISSSEIAANYLRI